MKKIEVDIEKIKAQVENEGIEFVDLKFVDLFGTLLHLTITSDLLTDELFEKGIGFDGSSVRGFRAINESDMIIRPDITSLFRDPFSKSPTLSFFCDIVDPNTGEVYERDPRGVARRAEEFLKSTGIADTAYFGPELEFFILDHVRFDQGTHYGFYYLDNEMAFWNSGSEKGPGLGYQPKRKKAYFMAQPNDAFQDLRNEMVKTLKEVGVESILHHHEVGSGGQSEIGILFSTPVYMGDNALKYKYVIKNVARRHGKTVTFMPKPLFEENGNGMHTNVSLWKDGKNLFFDANGYAELSETAVYFIGGLLKHAPALCAICNPTTNSYRRLVPGYEAPINLAYSKSNRSACVRIPMNISSSKAKRIEYRTPDPSANPYLAFSAILMAGIDGIINKIEPPKPLEKDIYSLSPEELKELGIKNTPASLEEALDALEKDHEFLLRGDVFSEDFIQTWLQLKRKEEVDFIRLRPHPGEFFLYFDI